MNSFYLSWGLSALALLLLAGFIGRQAKFGENTPTYWAILIDVRERYSLNRLQLVMWTLLVLSTFMGLLLCNWKNPSVALAIPNELLGLMGISVGSATISGAVKDKKNTDRPHKIAAGNSFITQRKSSQDALDAGEITAKLPRFVQVFLEEEGNLGENEIISITKFQNFIFTMALGVIYIVLACKSQGYPAFDQQVLWLIGITHGGYIGGKLPDKD